MSARPGTYVRLSLSPYAPDDDDDRDAIARVVDEWLIFDPEKIEEADSWNEGTLGDEHYSAVERALADLSAVPADRLIGSDELARVLRLAEVHGRARLAQLETMAEAAVESDRRTAEEDHAEMQAWAKGDAA